MDDEDVVFGQIKDQISKIKYADEESKMVSSEFDRHEKT